ncbi:hypothetical protein AHAS_Ahas15G0366700 [Arachis hypogaea]
MEENEPLRKSNSYRINKGRKWQCSGKDDEGRKKNHGKEKEFYKTENSGVYIVELASNEEGSREEKPMTNELTGWELELVKGIKRKLNFKRKREEEGILRIMGDDEGRDKDKEARSIAWQFPPTGRVSAGNYPSGDGFGEQNLPVGNGDGDPYNKRGGGRGGDREVHLSSSKSHRRPPKSLHHRTLPKPPSPLLLSSRVRDVAAGLQECRAITVFVTVVASRCRRSVSSKSVVPLPFSFYTLKGLMSNVEDNKEQRQMDVNASNESSNMPSSQKQEEAIKKKYGGMMPKKPPLISKDHERAYFDSADWALGKQGGEKPKGPLEALRPKLQCAA